MSEIDSLNADLKNLKGCLSKIAEASFALEHHLANFRFEMERIVFKAHGMDWESLQATEILIGQMRDRHERLDGRSVESQ